MKAFAAIDTAVAVNGLAIVGGFNPSGPGDQIPEGVRTVLLLGPGGPELWQVFSNSSEFQDGAPHGLDRWSERVVNALAEELGALAAFPFGGPPWIPFHKWAAAGEHAVSSPVGMQASPSRGLWASYRGALMFRERLDLPNWPVKSPCAPCSQPCLTACPVDAFASGSYDVPRCVAHVTSEAGAPCRDGCLVRKTCPAGQKITLPGEQRTFHMAAFLRANAI